MKCQSVACLWPSSPPQHKVTAAIVLINPPALYTGGSDGSIIWWNLTSSDTGQYQPWPMAMLCGHASAIADLTPCSPLIEPSSISGSDPGSDGCDALFSACSDGVLCVWSGGSGHCRKRRRLPPWAGKPCRLSPLPGSARYICVACVYVDASASHMTEEEGPQNCKGLKFSFFILDSCALTVVQTVFHGALEIGELRYAAMVPDFKDGKKRSIIVADAAGKVQVVAAADECDKDEENNEQRSVLSNVLCLGAQESSIDGEHMVSVVVHGKLLAVIFGKYCIFKSTVDSTVIGEISLDGAPICNEVPSEFAGGMFIKGGSGSNTSDFEKGFTAFFILWCTSGAAVIYAIWSSKSSLNIELNFVALSGIPALANTHHPNALIHFCQFNQYLVRIESFGFSVENSLIWRPHITVWMMPEFLFSISESKIQSKARDDSNSIHFSLSTLIGESVFPANWVGYETCESNPVRCSSNTNRKGKGINNVPQKATLASHDTVNASPGKCKSIFKLNQQIVQSSLILCDDFHIPYAIVYGFSNGVIEGVKFSNLLAELNSEGEDDSHHTDRQKTQKMFLGHQDGICCLAAHHTMATANEHTPIQVLISGSLDCTVRLWDLETCNVIAVLHHHVAAVRQIILAPPGTDRPWNNCFLSVGEDGLVALVSLETLRVERMFPGHPCYPSVVVWDGSRGYLACPCRTLSSSPDAVSTLYIWDIKSGARERIIRGSAASSMFDYFCRAVNDNAVAGNALYATTSASILQVPVIEDASFPNYHVASIQKGNSMTEIIGKPADSIIDNFKRKLSLKITTQDFSYDADGSNMARQNLSQPGPQNRKHPIKCCCPFPGLAAFKFDLASLMSLCQTLKHLRPNNDREKKSDKNCKKSNIPYFNNSLKDTCDAQVAENQHIKELMEGYLIRFSLSFLHFWGVEIELDKLLMDEMNVLRPEGLLLGSGVPGDRGSLTLMFPGSSSTLELWKLSSEYSAMRSLTTVSLAQRLIALSHSTSAASSALAAFYTRNFAEKVPNIKPPMLQLLASFWQDSSEHVRMAARSLFHCAAPRAAPLPICCDRISRPTSPSVPVHVTEEFPSSNGFDTSSLITESNDHVEDADIAAWLGSYEIRDWISFIGGTFQDAMASHVIVAAALAVWYPSIVKTKLAAQVANHLIKLVMTANERYSSTAAELLAEGMDNTWKAHINHEIPQMMADIFFQIDCISGSSASNSRQNPLQVNNIRETLVGILLPSLAMADIPGFLHVIESQMWAMSSDSAVHLVALTTLTRVIRGLPKPLAPYLDKVVNFILQTMDHTNPAMRRICLQSSITALREAARAFPMIALDEAFSRLAVGDAVGDIHDITIRVYDLQSLVKIKVLDASAPPGLPSLLSGMSDAMPTTAISVLSFSPDGEGLVAFSEHGLVIRWWSLGSAWWEKLSRSLVPVQCTKLIFVPPWEGFSPNSSRSSIIASIAGHNNRSNLEEIIRESNDAKSPLVRVHNLDLSYRLEWLEGRKVLLTRLGRELGSFQF